MFHRLAFPLLFFVVPRLFPQLIRFLRLAWRLQWDKRVPVALRALVPLGAFYFILPVGLIPDKVPRLGLADDIIILGLATLLLVKLSPKRVVDELMGRPPSPRPEDKDPSKVVDGSSKLVE